MIHLNDRGGSRGLADGRHGGLGGNPLEKLCRHAHFSFRHAHFYEFGIFNNIRKINYYNKRMRLFLSLAANSSIMMSSDISQAVSFSMESIERSESLSSVILVRSLVLILFIVEKDLSLSLLVTAMVKAI